MNCPSNLWKKTRQVEATTPQGKLRGSIATNFRGENYYRFQGIPYAKPPLGHLRFKAPVFPDKWSGVLEATKEGSPSYGKRMFNRKIVEGSEDCLFLNVYTKHLGDEILNPVMFYIHGGGLVLGSGGEFYGPEFLLTQDVVVVSVNYRLGILGFLSLEDPSLEVPGNAGFKDIVMALKWVQNNIDHFGGDTKNVTIFGNSAGGSIVHLLMMSEMGKGLFHKSISQSGNALTTWNPGKGCSGAISQLLNTRSEKIIYEKLMAMTVEEIYEIQKKIDDLDDHVAGKQRNLGFVVEKESKVERFLMDDPLKILQRGNFCHVPYLLGYNDAEFLANKPENIPGPGSNTCEDLIPFYLGFQIGSEKSLNAAKKLKEFYFGSDTFVEKSLVKKNFINFDTTILYGIYVAVTSHYSKSESPLYLYRMSLDTRLNFVKNVFRIKYPGAAHCDDIGYLFKNHATPDFEPGSIEDLSVQRFVKLWTNFAKYGNPTPQYDPSLGVIWKPVTSKEVDFLEIGETLVASKNPKEFERMKVLEKVFNLNYSDKKLSCHL